MQSLYPHSIGDGPVGATTHYDSAVPSTSTGEYIRVLCVYCVHVQCVYIYNTTTIYTYRTILKINSVYCTL